MASLWGELKRRNVVKVGGAYAIVAWALVEIVATVEAPLGLPDWVDTLVIVLLAVGFPIALILSWAYDMTPQGIRVASDSGPPVGGAHVLGHRFNYVILGLMVAILGFLVLDRFVLAPATTIARTDFSAGTPSGAIAAVQRLHLDVSPVTTVGLRGVGMSLVLSPDGTRLVYSARTRGERGQGLYLRELDQWEARLISNTELADSPFFSPDGERVVFDSDLGLTTIPLRGGAQQVVDTDYLDSFGTGTWIDDDTIIFSANIKESRSLYRMPASGGTPELLLGANDREGYSQPEALPGGDTILFTIRPGPAGGGPAREGSIGLLMLATGETKPLIGTAHRPRYATSGHIVFVRAGSLWAVPFDVDSLEVTGPEVMVVEGVQHHGHLGWATYALSDNGLLVYVPGGDVSLEQERTLKRLVWVDQAGREALVDEEARDYLHPRVSPDDQRLAVTVDGPDNQDIWIYDLTRGGLSRLTDHTTEDTRPIWTPDGRGVVFRCNRDGGRVCLRAANGAGPVTRLSERGTQKAFTLDGELILETYDGDGPAANQVLRVAPMVGDGTSESFVDYRLRHDGDIDLSPDGRWVAYTSSETGTQEIYVRPFPNLDDDRFQISTDGGFEPLWALDGGALFYRNGDAMMRVSVETEPEFSYDTPEVLFRGDYAGVDTAETTIPRPSYDVTADGRFLMLKYADAVEQESDSSQLRVVNNWFEELRRLAPSSDAE